MANVGSSHGNARGTWIFAMTAAQLGIALSLFLFEARPKALATAGAYVRSALATLLGWDQHRRLHDPVAGWGPLLIVVAVVVAVALAFGRGRRLPLPLEGLLNLSIPWAILTLTTDAWFWRWSALCVLPFVVLAWLYEAELPPWRAMRSGRRGMPWSLLLSAPLWVLMLRDVNPWFAPISGLSVVLGLAGLLAWRVAADGRAQMPSKT